MESSSANQPRDPLDPPDPTNPLQSNPALIQRSFNRVNVEISNVCNLKCSFCPSGSSESSVMTVELFERIIKQLRPLTDEVVLHLLGEPLGHPQFSAMIEVCSRHQMPVNIVTNGLLLNGDKVSKLLDPIVRQVSFSLQSFTNNFPDSSTQQRLGYLRRIAGFLERATRERPDLYVNLRLWDLGAEATQSDLRASLAEVFGFSWSDVAFDVRRKKNWRLRGRAYLHFDSRFEWPDSKAPIRSAKGFCHGLSGHFGIHANGTVVPCCLDHKAEMPLGSAADTDIEEILAGPRATAIRSGFQRRELIEDLCQRCTFIQRFD